MDDLALASEFPAATREAWTAAVDRVLKGADFERVLVGRTADGVRIEPLYPKAEAPSAVAGRAATPWRVVGRVDHPDPAEANALALADLAGGADALAIILPQSGAARSFGLGAPDVDGLDRALAGVMLDLIAVRIEAGAAGRQAASALVALAERRGQPLGKLDLDLGLDPIGAGARNGRMSAGWDVVAARLSDIAGDFAGRGFTGRVALADGRPYHEAGGSEAQELAAVLATAVAYLRALEAGGHELAAARASLSFLLVADGDEFMTVAKFRALRRLWAGIETACGLEPAPLRLHAETAWRMITRRDPWANLLRGTLAAFSAGIGGADDVAVLPFTAALGLPDAFARRLARNTQVVLLEEANLWRVADPTAGSGAFEALTDALVERAWTLFGEIEREGGIVASLGTGALQGRIAAMRQRRDAAVATRREPMIGTSEFPDLREAPVGVLMVAPPEGARPPEPPSPAPDGPTWPALPSLRSAEPFERLRELSDAASNDTGSRPRVFLADLGPVAAFTARSTFARNAFEAGGIEAVSSNDTATAEAMVEAFRTSGAAIACLCSSDAVYGSEAVPAALALRAAGAKAVFLAGRPGTLETELRHAGVTGFLQAGGDLPTFIETALAALDPKAGSAPA